MKNTKIQDITMSFDERKELPEVERGVRYINNFNHDYLPLLYFVAMEGPATLRENLMRLYAQVSEDIICRVDDGKDDYMLGLSYPLMSLRMFCDALGEMINNEPTITIQKKAERS